MNSNESRVSTRAARRLRVSFKLHCKRDSSRRQRIDIDERAKRGRTRNILILFRKRDSVSCIRKVASWFGMTLLGNYCWSSVMDEKKREEKKPGRVSSTKWLDRSSCLGYVAPKHKYLYTYDNFFSSHQTPNPIRSRSVKISRLITID